MPDDSLQPPILLLGNVRSGTSMVQSFFEGCPGVVSWFEPRTVWMYADPARRHDRFTADDATPRVRAYIRKRFLVQQRALGGRVMEKTPSNVLRLPYVHAIFPECKLIYIIRDPLSQISSSEFRWRNAINRGQAWRRFLEAPKSQLHHYVFRAFWDHFRIRVLRRKYVSVWGVRYPGIYDDLRQMPREHIMARQWAACSRQMAEDIAALPAGLVYQVRYEDIVADPVSHFGRMCAHVGITPPPEAIEKVRAKIDPTRQEKWKRMAPELIEAIVPQVAGEMARHGYAPPEALPDEEERRRVAATAATASGPRSAREGV